MVKSLVVLMAAVWFVLVTCVMAFALPETFGWDAVTGATGYEIESSVNGGQSWALLQAVPLTSCTTARCSVTLTPSAGYTLYRVVVVSGTTRTTRTDAGMFACVGQASCPSPVSNIGVQ